MIGFLEQVNEMLSRLLWGPATLFLFLSVGLIYGIRCGFLPLTHPGLIWEKTVGSLWKNRRKNGVSPFAAMSAALAGTMGVGNITGIATALTTGGAGSIFWMWISALIGMMTKYGEILLAVRYRKKEPNGYLGGPMYYMRDGLGFRILPAVFCFLCILASFGVGNMTQSNALAQAAKELWNTPLWLSGLLCAAIVGLVTVGGIRRISAVTCWVIPILTLMYLIFSLAVLIRCRQRIIPSLQMIFRDAFSFSAIAGGAAGFSVSRAVRYGFARGIFTNEAGLGSAPIAHAAANAEHPAEQGLWGIFEVFADTIVACTLTALVILTSEVAVDGFYGASMTGNAFQLILGQIGGDFVRFSLLFYAIAAMLGWAFYGEQATMYLFGRKKHVVNRYRAVFLCCCFLGSVTRLELVWSIADTLNGLMALPNLAALVLLSREAAVQTKDYLILQKDAKKRPS